MLLLYYMVAFVHLICCTALLNLFYSFSSPFFCFLFCFFPLCFSFLVADTLAVSLSGTSEAVLGIAQFSQGAVGAKKATDPFLAIMWIGWLSTLIWKLTVLLFPIWGYKLSLQFLLKIKFKVWLYIECGKPHWSK